MKLLRDFKLLVVALLIGLVFALHTVDEETNDESMTSK